MSERRELYPGILDPDGRPWTFKGGRESYYKSLVWLLKITLLTQSQLLVPRGYFFDNLEFQRMLWNFTGNDDESKCFSQLMRDFLRVGCEEGSIKLSSSNDWMDLLDGWIKGSGVSSIARDVPVYPNLLSSEEHLNAILNVNDPGHYRDMFIEYGNIENKIHLGDLFDRLAKLGLRAIQPSGSFDFDARVRKALDGTAELDIDRVILEKVATIADACKKSGIPRISRSILQNQRICREVGISDDGLVSPHEYRTHLMFPMRHWHQMADALAWEAGAVCSETKVSVNATALDNTIVEIADSIREGDLRAWFTISQDFPKLSFCDILTVRSKQTFYEGLWRLDDAVGKSNAEFLRTFEKHWRDIVGTLRWKSRRPERTQIDGLIAETGKVISPDPIGVFLTEAARFIISLGPNIVSKLQKEGELHWFLRRVRKI